MKAKSILLFQFGNSEAIRDVAQSRSAWWVGGLLVITAGIAREYDQTLFSLYGFRVLFPLFFSLIAAFLLRFFLKTRLNTVPKMADAAAPEPCSVRTFLGLFWMTAPMAWLYAFPVERLFDSREAAVVNVAILLGVALWRVLIFSNALRVITGLHFLDALSFVLLPSSVLMGLGSVGASLSLVQLMGGLRHSPEDLVLKIASESALTGSAVIFIISLGAYLFFRTKPKGKMLSKPMGGGAPIKTLVGIYLLWIPICIVPQLELARTTWVERLVYRNQHNEALIYLSSHAEDDFAPARRLPPDPYSYLGQDGLLKTFEAMDGREADWVHAHYLKQLELIYGQDRPKHNLSIFWRHKGFCIVLESLVRLPAGRAWAKRHSLRLVELHDYLAFAEQRQTTPDIFAHDRRRLLLGKLKIDVPALSINETLQAPAEVKP